MRFKIVLVSLHLLVWCSIIFAGTTGKIAGIITDADNNQPLAGVNVFLEDTQYGASTDLDGYYSILNVLPGNYDLKIEYIGYAEHKIEKVIVKIDLTSRMDVQLRSQIIEGSTIIIEAERPIVTRDISNSQVNIEAKEVEAMPVQTVNEILNLQAGIEMGSEGILVRGGSANQTVFMVDGLSTNDERSNIPYTTMSLSSIEEIKIQTGGFSAEYGDARSGLINVVSKEGGRKRYSASAIINYSPAARKHFGPSIYRADSYFNRPFMDPEVCWTGTNNGAWDEDTRNQYPNFEGWNSISENTLKDKDPANDLTPEGARRLFEWQRRREGDIDKPDYVIDIGVGGPIPFISNNLGNLRFYLSHFREQEMFIFPLSKDAYSEHNTKIKFTSELSPSMKLNISGSYGEISSVSPYQWTTTPTGRILRSQGEIADLTNSNSGASILYMPDYFSPTDIYRSAVGLKFTHALNQKLFYEVKLQYKTNKYNTYQAEDRDRTKKYKPIEGSDYIVDEAPFGYYGHGVSAIDGTSLGGWMNLGRDKSENSTTTFGIDLTNQFDSRNQIKAGFNIIYNDFNTNSTTESPSMNTWTRSLIYRIFPFRIGAYIQDKLEFEGFIANLGLRFDYSDANSSNYLLSIYDPNYKAGYGSSLEKNVPFEDTKADWAISPRLGVSHPITDDSKLFFNYNHFRSEPRSSYRFRIQRESNGLVTYMGNPNLEMEKTIAYEVGYEQNLFDQYLIRVAAYYKDVTNQPGWIYYRNITGTVQYRKTANNNYEDIRGFEITLTKRVGNWFRGFINYTYDVKTSGYFGLREYYENRIEQSDYLDDTPYQSKPRPRPYARANINANTPPDFGPEWIGIKPMADWNLNILADWKTGRYYTYNPNNTPGVIDDTQWKDWYNIDLRLAKHFRISNIVELQFYVDFANVFNFKHLDDDAGFSDNYDWDSYLESLNFSWETGEQHGDDKIGDYRPTGVDYDPLELNPNNDPDITARNNARKKDKSYIDMPNIKSFTFLNPRKITFGLRINF